MKKNWWIMFEGYATGEDPILSDVRRSVRTLCSQFPEQYWMEMDLSGSYPTEFVNEMTKSGWLGLLIPEEYGGGGGSMMAASVVLEEIHQSGGSAAGCHAQMYIMGALLRHGSDEQKARYLPDIASGKMRLQSMAVTEPDAGSDTTQITTRAELKGDVYLINGEKVFISRVEHTDLMLVLARTTMKSEAKSRTHGLSLFVVDVGAALEAGTLEVSKISTMVNHHSTSLRFNGLVVHERDRIGEQDEGFRYLLSGLNAERILISSESIGDGMYFVRRASEYATERHVFGRAIGENQGIQFPISEAYMHVRASSFMRDYAATLCERGEPYGSEANMAKWLSSVAACQAGDIAMMTFGGYGMASEYGIERKFREARLNLVAPVSNNMVLGHIATHVLKMPRSF